MWARGDLQTGPQDDAATAIDDALAGLGLVPDRPVQVSDGAFCLWPENVPAFDLWAELQTQWRVGPAGPTGLDYAGVAAHLQHAHRLRPRALRERWEQLQAMEQGALQGWAEKRGR